MDENNIKNTKLTYAEKKKNYITCSGNIAKNFKKRHFMLFQQVNCCAIRLKKNGLAAALALEFPQTNEYIKRTSFKNKNLATPQTRGVLKSVNFVNSDDNTKPIIANLFSQYCMGKPCNYYINDPDVDENYKNTCIKEDSKEKRVENFKVCLKKVIDKLLKTNCFNKRIKFLVFPEKIGCASAGGNWLVYEKIINKFAKYVNKELKGLKVYICKYKR